MTASSSSHSRSSSISGSSTGAPKGKGKKAIETEEEESRDEIAVLSTESSTIDDSDDEEMKPPSKGKKARSTKHDDLGRTRAKTVGGVIMRYKRALHAFNQAFCCIPIMHLIAYVGLMLKTEAAIVVRYG
ncbi:hypothetical protein SRHO_G00105410 [Serrasalmus rhombeus]